MQEIRDMEKMAAAEDAKAPKLEMTAAQAGRMMMAGLDPLLRKLPYEQRTAVLLNLLVTYAAEQPAAVQRRGKFINAMVEEFRKRMQQFLPLNPIGAVPEPDEAEKLAESVRLAEDFGHGGPDDRVL